MSTPVLALGSESRWVATTQEPRTKIKPIRDINLESTNKKWLYHAGFKGNEVQQMIDICLTDDRESYPTHQKMFDSCAKKLENESKDN